LKEQAMKYRTTISAGLLFLLVGCATTAPPPATPDALFKEGEKLYSQKKYEEAIETWKKVKDLVSAPDLIARTELKIADANFSNKNYIEAAAGYEDFRKFHPDNEKVPYALYRTGLCYFNQITGIDTEQTPVNNAVTMFESFLRHYPSSEFAADVKAKLEECRTKQLQYQIYVGRFYYRTEKYQAAANRLADALVKFPDLKINDETLYYLGRAYLKMGNKAKGDEALKRLLKEYPASRFLPEATKLLKES
jgi:outer membrane protein assembly factor BamD